MKYPKKVLKWAENRARPFEKKWVTYLKANLPILKDNVKIREHEDKNKIDVLITPPYCPCGECNNKWMVDCEEHNHDCCSETCH